MQKINQIYFIDMKKEQFDGLIDKVKELGKKFGFSEEPEAAKFIDAELSDGTKVKIEGESLVQGAKVMVVTESGEVPAPDGEHELSDGSKIMVAGGVITEIMPKAEQAAEEQFNSEEAIKTLIERIEAIESRFNEAEKVKSEMAAMKEGVKELFSIVEKLASLPQEAPTEQNFNSQAKPDRVKELVEVFKKLKK